jgi:hypothetical protein
MAVPLSAAIFRSTPSRRINELAPSQASKPLAILLRIESGGGSSSTRKEQHAEQSSEVPRSPRSLVLDVTGYIKQQSGRVERRGRRPRTW